MPLIRQVWLMVLGVLLIALVGSVITHTLIARQSLYVRLQVHNDDVALALAQVLSQHPGDAESTRRLAAAQFDAGQFQSLRLLRNDGSVLFEDGRPVLRGRAPGWFVRLLPLNVEPGVAQVTEGWRPVGTLQLSTQAGWVWDELWIGGLRVAGWLAVLGLAATAGALAVSRPWQRSLDAVVAQARALEARRFVLADEPRAPELRPLARSLNSLALRLQAASGRQAAMLDDLRLQAHSDALTGLPNRGHFVAQLDAALQAERFSGGGLLLVRLQHLPSMNRRIGREATDRLLAALAQVLQSYPRRVKGALAGRLNGADLALYLPAAGIAGESAASLADALRAALATVDHGAELVIGGAELAHPAQAAQALSLADGALARAECGGPFAVEIAAATPVGTPARGERQWHAQIEAALQSARLQPSEFEVRGPTGALLHLDFPIRMQFDADGPFEPAARWRAMAVRCRLIDQVDLAVIDLALAAIERDGLPRCVNVSAASLAADGFIARVQRRLQADLRGAAGLWIGLAEGALLQATRVYEAATLWRRTGVRIGLAHAGVQPRDLSLLAELGVDYLKIDGAFVRGVATVPAVRELARALVALVRGMDMQILADAVAQADDLAALWALGFDGVTAQAPRCPAG